ncbi:MAG: hypothetical protein NT077_04795 [Candidatus Taylorbacteria bacterium]|nr:hypothetical protein [Candidatus Taylorbacteria bacterium]
MKTKPIIAIDIDDVIAANAPAFIEFSNQRFGTHLTTDDYHERWAELWKVDHEEAERRSSEFHESGHVYTYKVIPGAQEVLKDLKIRFKLVLITSRRLSIEKLTRSWIEKYYSEIFDDVVFAGFFDTPGKDRLKLTKASLAKNAEADFLIDDQLKHVEAAASIGIKGLLFGEYSWNKKEELSLNVVRVRDWNEILEYFKKYEISKEY